MSKNILVVVTFILPIFLFINVVSVFGIGETDPCSPIDNLPNHGCDQGLSCKPFQADRTRGSCETDVFGQIQPPPAIQNLLKGDPTGAAGISRFLTNLITLFFSLAGIVLIFMLIWGAFDWMTSEGDKEKLSNAQKKIISAIIGIVLFAIAFAIIQVLGTFTGFKFFVGQQ